MEYKAFQLQGRQRPDLRSETPLLKRQSIHVLLYSNELPDQRGIHLNFCISFQTGNCRICSSQLTYKKVKEGIKNYKIYELQ